MEMEDAGIVLRYRSDPVANCYQGWIPKTIDDVRDFIENRVARTIDTVGTWFQLVMIKKADNALIGDIGVHFLDAERQQVELGFTLDREHQGRGYATEALTEIIEHLFNELKKHRIVAAIDPRNGPSIALVARLGFRKEAHFKESIRQNGVWVDDLLYALLESEWRAGKF